METSHQQLHRRNEIKRLGKFGIVGILNTLIDFVSYNLFSTHTALTLAQSNLISTTLAMLFSFVANKKVVFAHADAPVVRQAVIFFTVTIFGLYVLQTGTIVLLTDLWLAPVKLGLSLAHAVGITGHDDFLIKNGAKVIATGLSLTWNYVMYKKVVFK